MQCFGQLSDKLSMSKFCVALRASVSAELNVTCDREKIRRTAHRVCAFDSFSTCSNRIWKNFFAASMSR